MNLNRTFPGMREDEVIKLWIHKHWIVYFRIFFYTTLFGGGLTLVITHISTRFFNGMAFLQIILFILIIYLLSMWLWAYLRWIDEDFDCVIITDQRIIDITQDGLFSLSISETSLDLLQDVRDTTSGFWSNLLHYGSLSIQTAARDRVFQIDHIANPGSITQAILNEKEDFLTRHGDRVAQTGSAKSKTSKSL